MRDCSTRADAARLAIIVSSRLRADGAAGAAEARAAIREAIERIGDLTDREDGIVVTTDLTRTVLRLAAEIAGAHTRLKTGGRDRRGIGRGDRLRR